VIIGIRPEDYEDAALAPEIPESQRIMSKVSLIEALGSEIMVGAEGANAVGRFNPRSTARMGQEIEIAISTENMHFFDPTPARPSRAESIRASSVA
jgi:multiple sugar transport system ATP-binding protein